MSPFYHHATHQNKGQSPPACAMAIGRNFHEMQNTEGQKTLAEGFSDAPEDQRLHESRIKGMAKKKKSTAKAKEPWEKPAPKKSRHTKLSPKSKSRAKAAAKKAGRKYPSLVDNMNAAKKQKRGKARSSSKS